MKKHQHLINWLKEKGEYKEAEVEYVGIPIIMKEPMPSYIDTVLKEKIDIMVDAWYRRTLPMIDLDNEGERTPPLTMEAWGKTVKKDLERLLQSSLEHFAQDISKLKTNCNCWDVDYCCDCGYNQAIDDILALLNPTQDKKP